MDATAGDRAVALAARMLQLGLTHAAVVELLGFPPDAVEAQLDWLPYRKAKRPGAFLIDAVRHNYSPPKEAYYAKALARRRRTDAVDEDPELDDRPSDADIA